MSKRIATRAIIMNDNKLLVMERHNNDKDYFTLPGGGMDDDETLTECVKREIKEECSIDIFDLYLRYEYEDEYSKQYIFLAKTNNIDIHLDINSEEYNERPQNNNIYLPKWIEFNDIENMDLKPIELKNAIIKNKDVIGPIIKFDGHWTVE